MPLFSVIIPTFNRASLLAEALASVFAQRFADYEVIVADDGSTDATDAVLAQYAGRIETVRQSNQGPGAARNLAAARATGEYLAFLDSDDRWFPWTLGVYASIIVGSHPAFIAGKPAIFQEAAQLSGITEGPLEWSAFDDYFASSDEWRWYSASSFVIRTSAFRDVGGFAPVWINGEDADLAMRIGTAGQFVQVTSPATFGYRDHASSLVSQSTRTLDGVRHALQMEQLGLYPGGPARARERRIILSRQFRPVMVTCLQQRQFAEAWRLYWSTWSWHVRLRRFKFLAGFPVQAMVAAMRHARGKAA